MENLKLVFNADNEDKLTGEAKMILKNSGRQYQNIEFEETFKQGSEFFLSFLAKRAGSWKSVILKTLAWRDRDFLPELLAIIETSVEDLSIFFDPRFLYVGDCSSGSSSV